MGLKWIQPVCLSAAVLLFILHIASSSLAEHAREKRQVWVPHGPAMRLEGWGQWTNISSCSRTCGGGVLFQQRKCNAQNLECTGASRQFQSCNVQNCPDDAKDFRAVQCSMYNNVTFNNTKYNWVPYYSETRPCELNCLAKGEMFYYRHAAMVVDGTTCNYQQDDLCVQGVCRKVGCDRLLGSQKHYDKCRVCGGDGTTCQSYEGMLFSNNLKHGYTDLLVIPSGATSIRITELSGSNNYFALVNSDGKYVLNGDLQISLPHTLTMAGTDFTYSHKEKTHPTKKGPESIAANGPINQTVYFSLLKQKAWSPGIRYEYSLPLEGEYHRVSHMYNWNAQDWTPCTSTCGGGSQTREVLCVDEQDVTMNNKVCNPTTTPAMQQACNTQPCPPPAQWMVSHWSVCTQTCRGGIQVRVVKCMRYDNEEVPEEECLQSKPNTVQNCNNDTLCPSWVTENWSQCSRECGTGEQVRIVTCHSGSPIAGAATNLLPDSMCDDEGKPNVTQECNHKHCGGVEWVVSSWSLCPKQCESRTKTRQALCGSKNGDIYSDDLCDDTRKPSLSRQCGKPGRKCTNGPQWFTSDWGNCSTKCGKGMQYRTLVCAVKKEKTMTVLADSQCYSNKKPDQSQSCIQHCQGAWFAGPWHKCSKSCGGGRKKRTVLCLHPTDNTPVDESLCDENSRPNKRAKCGTKPCDQGDCEMTAYGCCPDKITPADGPKYFGCPSKDTIPIGLCIESAYGCCPDGLRPAKGPFLHGCPEVTCEDTLAGCCPDGKTPAAGGCPIYPKCDEYAYGCCQDGQIPAQGPNYKGCKAVMEETEGSGEPCEDTLYGCCPDGDTAATGTHLHGCDGLCVKTKFGCCSDNKTAATGPNMQGCQFMIGGCAGTRFGCCPDAIQSAEGPDFEGCNKVLVLGGCEGTRHGCCPDHRSPATGPNYQGCELKQFIPVCDRTTYGCCLDGQTVAAGKHFHGCTDAKMYTPSCHDQPYGCCPDAKTPAGGPNDAGCPNVVKQAAACSHGRHMGTCRQFRVMWYYDAVWGDCTRFWYGGCGGNINRFNQQQDCRNACIEPKGLAVCYLPKTSGHCEAKLTRYFYNKVTKKCEEFRYGGCLGNKNNFKKKEECLKVCEEPQRKDICRQPKQHGPCKGGYERWYYDFTSGVCKTFEYGGCLGNENHFDSKESCNQRCRQPPEKICKLSLDRGSCVADVTRWYFNVNKNTCDNFTYGGCEGNSNRFISEHECQQTCRKFLFKDPCKLRADAGPCEAYKQRWYYDMDSGYCDQFVYGGCDGNDNRFNSEQECRKRCNANPPPDICKMPQDSGPCNSTVQRYYFDEVDLVCRSFKYGGCQGNNNRFTTLEECKKTCRHLHLNDTKENKIERCMFPADPGPCKRAIHLWYYDSVKQTCTRFTYGGCEGNSNRFRTRRECQVYCGVKQLPPTAPPTPTANATADKCLLPRSKGPCLASIISYYYDKSSSKCKQFLYGGCGGNDNRYTSKTECEEACISHTCSLPAETGQCLAYIQKWAYNKLLGRCQQFPYGGCGGNSNRFDTRVQCEKKCLQRTRQAKDQYVDCGLNKERGKCNLKIKRWYFNREKGICQSFRYTGCDGNANNFVTRKDCRKACPVNGICASVSDTGSCKASKTRYFFDTKTGRCTDFIYGGCGGNANRFRSQTNCERVCKNVPGVSQAARVTLTMRPTKTSDVSHKERVTENPTTTARATTPVPRTTLITLAPTAEDFHECKEPPDPGPCRDWSVKWYYDEDYQLCRRFHYGGCLGNRNRFDAQYDCSRFCIERIHKGLNLCDLPPEVGPCKASKLRWYYDSDSSTCSQFSYGGCDGNSNNFESREKCMMACGTPQKPKEKDGCGLPISKGPCRAMKHRWYYDHRKAVCKDFIYGGCLGNSNNFATKVECEMSCNGKQHDETDVCMKPRDVGPCKAVQLHWYFDQNDGMCKPFNYGGCQGNGNRFSTRIECEAACAQHVIKPTKPKTRAACFEKKQMGPCFAEFLRFYYDSTFKECRPFIYGGCQGNDNNFESQSECYHLCGDPRKTKALRNPGDCFKPADAGRCHAPLPRWYYNMNKGDCSGFYYGGCEGNRNNFRSYDDCIAYCSKAATICGVLQCNLDCPHGFARSPDGCPECRCYDPCEEHDCPDDMECKVQKVACANGPCPAQPTCKPKPKPGECPVVTESGGSCLSECHSDSDCVGKKKCCSNGCAETCLEPSLSEQAPEIKSKQHASVVTVHGKTVVLTCSAIGVPKPLVTWYKNKDLLKPMIEQENHIEQLADDSLEIKDVDKNDTAMYTCKAVNGIGDDAAKTYSLTVQDPPKITNKAQDMELSEGKTATLECLATGMPQPYIRWLRHGDEVQQNSRVKQTPGGSLVIRDLIQTDAGEYTCEAHNGVGATDYLHHTVTVLDKLVVEVATHDTEYTSGDNIELVCTTVTSSATVSWTKDGRPLTRSKNPKPSVVKIKRSSVSDSGNYTCTARRKSQEISHSTLITVNQRTDSPGLPAGCIDKPFYANCKLIVEADYCEHTYFSVFCCKSCHLAGKL